MRLLVLIIIVATVSPVFSRERETLEQLKDRVEHSSGKDRIAVALRVAEHQTDAADKLFADGKSDEARTAIQDVITYSQKAADAATESGKKLKDAEITVRKIAYKLKDIKRSVNFDDQAPVQNAIDQLERVRTQLLDKMFDLGKGTP